MDERAREGIRDMQRQVSDLNHALNVERERRRLAELKLTQETGTTEETITSSRSAAYEIDRLAMNEAMRVLRARSECMAKALSSIAWAVSQPHAALDGLTPWRRWAWKVVSRVLGRHPALDRIDAAVDSAQQD